MMCALISKLHTEKTDIFNFKWVDTVKSTLDHTGFSSIWEAHEIDTAKFKACFSQRCKDIFQQQWHEEVSRNSQCTTYCKFKESFHMEDYLSNLEDCHKFNLTRFRTRTHHLPITKHRFHDDSAALWRHHNWSVTSCEREILVLWRHICLLSLHAKIGAKAIVTSE